MSGLLKAISGNKNSIPANIAMLGIPQPTSPNTRTMGIDLSHHNDVDSFKEVDTVIDWVYCKATEANSFRDGAYPAFRKAIRLTTMLFGSYHFLRFNVSGKVQADFFLDYIEANGGVLKEDFLVLDWETTSGPGDLVVVRDFLERVKERAKRRCFIYVNYYVEEAAKGDDSFLIEYPLLVPNYSKEPSVPTPWKTWNVWQDSESAKIPGIARTADHDIFRGDINDLKRLIAYTNL